MSIDSLLSQFGHILSKKHKEEPEGRVEKDLKDFLQRQRSPDRKVEIHIAPDKSTLYTYAYMGINLLVFDSPSRKKLPGREPFILPAGIMGVIDFLPFERASFGESDSAIILAMGYVGLKDYLARLHSEPRSDTSHLEEPAYFSGTTSKRMAHIAFKLGFHTTDPVTGLTENQLSEKTQVYATPNEVRQALDNQTNTILFSRFASRIQKEAGRRR